MSLYLRHRQSVGRGLVESPQKIESNESSVKELPNRALSSANGVRENSKVVDDLPSKEKIKKFEELQKSLESLKLNELREGQKGRPKKKPLSIKI